MYTNKLGAIVLGKNNGYKRLFDRLENKTNKKQLVFISLSI